MTDQCLVDDAHTADEAQNAPAADEVIVARSASLAYAGRPALTGVDFAVRAGQVVALIGPNGAGKSTLLRGLLGEVPVVAGSLLVLGRPPSTRTRALIGYLPQEDSRVRDFPVSVRQVVMMGRYRRLGWFRQPGRTDREAVSAALDVVGLQDKGRTRFGELSGGQQQRVILARALVANPRVLLLDEPFNGLDQDNREALIEAIARLRDSGVAVLVSTHDFDLARRVCDHVLLLNGHQVAYGPQDEVLAAAGVDKTLHDAQSQSGS